MRARGAKGPPENWLHGRFWAHDPPDLGPLLAKIMNWARRPFRNDNKVPPALGGPLEGRKSGRASGQRGPIRLPAGGHSLASYSTALEPETLCGTLTSSLLAGRQIIRARLGAGSGVLGKSGRPPSKSLRRDRGLIDGRGRNGRLRVPVCGQLAGSKRAVCGQRASERLARSPQTVCRREVGSLMQMRARLCAHLERRPGLASRSQESPQPAD